jgi:glutamate formiminotransferase
VAYNIYLSSYGKDKPDVAAARAIARDLRASGGGMHGVKALGVLAHGRAQVSMNITDFRTTPVRQVFEMVRQLAARHGAAPESGELIGLIPADADEPESEWARQISGFDPEAKVLERRLESPLTWPE